METPRIEDRGSFLVAGSVERYQIPEVSGISRQWDEFARHLGKIPGQTGWTTYGVCFNMDDSGKMDYMCGVEVTEGAAAQEGMKLLRIEPQLYAVFSHRGNISRIKETWDAIFTEWCPASGRKLLFAPQFEVYDERFDPKTNEGVVEIWIPIER
ncbi:MAG TPA: GyrI-like domain-containing protein [Bryobacteraceae bacterium]|nr:GyrI-like domain-containing protein [Bryobacteraceae bacterium]